MKIPKTGGKIPSFSEFHPTRRETTALPAVYKRLAVARGYRNPVKSLRCSINTFPIVYLSDSIIPNRESQLQSFCSHLVNKDH